MASDAQANIILRLKDEFSKNLKDAGKNFQAFASEVDRVGTAMSRTGMKMVAIGTTMNAPFFAAAAAMKDYSFAASNEMIRLNNEVLSLSKVIAEAAMPSIKAFNDTLSKVINTLKTVDPALLANIANWAMTAGQILIAVGTIELFTGKVISLFAKMLKPMNLVILAIGALIYAWIEYHDVCMRVLNAVDVAFNQWVVNSLVGFEAIMKGLVTLSKFFPPMAGMYGPIKAGLDSLSNTIAGFRQNIVQAQNGNGAFANSVNKLGANIQGFAAKMKAAYASAASDLETVMKDLKSRVIDLTDTFSDGFGDAFSKVLMDGQSFAYSMKNLFKGIASSIIKDFTSTALKNVFSALLGRSGTNSGTGIGGLLGAGVGSIFGPIGTAVGGFLGGMLKFHEGGPIYAHNGLAPDEVPIIAQTGEGVLSRKGMKAAGGSNGLRKLNSGEPQGGGGQTIVINQIIQAWDASDVYKNRKILSAAIAEDIKNNGSMRQTINNSR
jgi:hypothetical protein